MNFKIGMIGSGNMATAIAKGIINSNAYTKDEILMSDVHKSQREKVVNQLGVQSTDDNNELVKSCETIILAVKPQYLENALSKIDKNNFKNKFIISIIVGTTIEKLKSLITVDCSIARVMPNTPALVNEAMSVICLDENIDEKNTKIVTQIFESIGKSKILNENMIDAVTAISGSSPAYVFMMIEAMADAGVLLGLSREDSYIFASQAILGSAKMYLETGLHPAILKDMVCSPAGTTIEAVKILENKGFRSSLINAMIACEQKAKNMNK